MKILWLSNIALSDSAIKSTGTWLTAMSQALVSQNDIILFNISQRKVNYYQKEKIGNITQWLVPLERLTEKGLPSTKTIKFIQNIVKDIDPDIIHIWGTENYWGLLTARGFIKGNILLEMQGLKYSCIKDFYGGLSFYELLKCIKIKEILKFKSSLFYNRYKFKKWGGFEKEIIQFHNNISIQSEWIRAHISAIKNTGRIFKTGMILRDEFTNSEKWKRNNGKLVLFTSTSGTTAYKGIHILFRALAILKKEFPNVTLKIAGSYIKGLKTSGYTKFLLNEAKRMGIYSNIEWLGSLNANDIVSQMHISMVDVVPSFVESYSMAFAEAMAVGIPCVVAYSGAMPELAQDNESALFYSANDEVMCANQIKKLITDKDLSNKLSKNSIRVSFLRNNCSNIVNNQLSIYKSIINEPQK
jgi:glycosyltransferase involved in cell wall biosynthesis